MSKSPELNKFIINGKSTADLPFFVAVEKNSPPLKARKKDKLVETDHTNGVLKQSVNAYGLIEKKYKFYVRDVTPSEFRQFKTFIADAGWFTDAWENDLKYYYERAELEIEELDMVNGYEVEVTFTCQPFGMEAEKTLTNPTTLTNLTNAPMYPKLTFSINTSSSTFIQIGTQKITLEAMIDTVTIECKHGYQDVIGTGGKKLNDKVKGDFFEVMPGNNAVTLGAGISNLSIVARWGWR